MGWRKLFEQLNLVLPLVGVFVGAMSFAFIAGGWFSQQNTDFFLLTVLGGAVGLIAAFVGGLAAGYSPVPQLKRAAAERQTELAETNTALARAKQQLESLVPAVSADVASNDPGLPPPSVQIWLRSMRTDDEVDLHLPSSIPILLIANLKGGVAKTMTAANLAAYFASRHAHHADLQNKRVLLVDLDYQGSLTNMVLNAFAVGRLHPSCSSRSLLSRDLSDLDALHYGVVGPNELGGIRFFPCEYGFDDFETRAQFEWLSRPVSPDVRLSLIRRLRSPTFQEEFDLVILDTGPRLTTGSVAALAAATHLLVPTTSDRRSMLAVEQFLRRVAEMKKGFALDGHRPVRLCPNLCLAGVLQTLTTNYANDVVLQDQARQGLAATLAADSNLAALFRPNLQPVLQNTLRRSGPFVSQAQAGIPYVQGSAARQIIDQLGLEIEERLQL